MGQKQTTESLTEEPMTLWRKYFRWKRPVFLEVSFTKNGKCRHWYDGLIVNEMLCLGKKCQLKPNDTRLEKKYPYLYLKSTNVDTLVFSTDDGSVVCEMRESTKDYLQGTLVKDKRKYDFHIHHCTIKQAKLIVDNDPANNPIGKYV